MIIELLSLLLPPVVIVFMIALPYIAFRADSGCGLLFFFVASTIASIALSLLGLYARKNESLSKAR
ncbi:MAG: hypothetical protein LM585_03745 [Fervidicoccaceae archaeon]|nr:hypothetical protein [Fervidicoccaceae archaeon]